MSIEIDFCWVKKCVESSLTDTHLHVGEKLISAFQKKWKEDPDCEYYTLMLENLHKEKSNEIIKDA